MGFQIKEQARTYDVIIIGSGAGGGMSAYTLANAGVQGWTNRSRAYV